MKPLDGIKVLDLTRILSGPFCTMTLGDMGAEIIKVEAYPHGDDSRENPPFVEGESMYFVSLNRNKKSIVINLKTEEGKKLLYKMAKEADILVENFKPGTTQKLKADYSVIKEINPGIIYCSISGFGQDGPYSSRPAYDSVVQAMSGIWSVTGHPGGVPTRVGTSIGDVFGGVFAIIGILGALRYRDQTGHGQYIDISMLDSLVAVVVGQIARYYGTGIVPKPVGNRHATATPFDLFDTRDGGIVIAVQKNTMFASLCKALGCPELIDDSRFTSNAERCIYQEELKRLLTDILVTKTTKEWMDILVDAGVACGPLNTIADVVNDPHIRARKMITDVTGHPKLDVIHYPSSPLKYSECECAIERPAPVLGQHTEEILKRFGLSDEDIASLKAQEVIG
jgi:CoA:oxalate CoA-transferase